MRPALAVVFVLGIGVFAGTILAESGASMLRTPVVIAAAGADGVRVAASDRVAQIRIAVVSSSGSLVFDSGWRDGNVLDWSGADQFENALAFGAYRMTVSARDLAGEVTERQASVTIDGEGVRIDPSPDTLTPRITMVVHDGRTGQIVNTSGDLAFRFGDFLMRKDTELMRLTADGRLGIGTAAPQAKLDVNGLIRTSEGIMFRDGTILRSTTTATSTYQPANATAGTGTVNQIPKWTDTVGTLADSAVSETGGKVVVGSTNVSGQIQVIGAATADVFSGMGADVKNGPAMNYGYAGSSFGRGAGFFNVRPDALAVAPNPSLRFETLNVQRMIITNAGNIGIATTSPTEKLEVAGNVKLSGGGTLIFPDSSSMATAGATHGANAFIGDQNITGNLHTTGNISADGSVSGATASFTGDITTSAGAVGAIQFNQGNARLLGDETGLGNLYVGRDAGAVNTGFSNVFVGQGAGAANTSATDNTYVGNSAGASSTGGQNSFLGSGAGLTTTGGHNAFFGYFSALNNTSGGDNSFFGSNAGLNNTTGTNNVALGSNAGSSLTTGNNNIDIGNTGLGGEGGTTRIGTPQTSTRAFIAGISGVTTQGVAGPVLIDGSGQLGTNGGNFSAGTITATLNGSATSFSGSLAGEVTGVQGATVVSNADSTNTANAIVRRDGSGNFAAGTVTLTGSLGIGTVPTALLHVIGTQPPTGGQLGFNATNAMTIFGGKGGNTLNVPSATGGTGASIIIQAGDGGNAPPSGFGLLPNTGGSGGSITLQPGAGGTSDNNGGRGTVLLNGVVAVGQLGAAGSTTLCRNTNNQIATCSSSIRYKDDVNSFRGGIELIRRLRPVTFRWKDGGKQDLGLIAEEVNEVEPLLTVYNDEGSVEGVKYDHLTVVLINAIKEQQAQLDDARRENEALRARLDRIEELLRAGTPARP